MRRRTPDRRSISIRIRNRAACSTTITARLHPAATSGKTMSLMRKLLRDRRGNAAIVAAAVLPLLIGAAGLAVDGIQWVLQKRDIQAAADSAAIAGVYGLIGDQNMENAVSDSLARTGGIPANASIQAVQSPAGHESDPFAVTVHL